MPDQERDAAADSAFEAWWAKREPKGPLILEWERCTPAVRAAWHAALAHVEKEREAANQVVEAARLHKCTVRRCPLWKAIAAYDVARAGAGETPG